MRIEFIFVSFTRLKKRRIRDRKEYLCFINIIKCSLIHLFAHTRLNLIYKLLDRCEQIDRICKFANNLRATDRYIFLHRLKNVKK